MLPGIVVAICLAGAAASLADDLNKLLAELKPLSLQEAQLRELAGKDHFKPYVANPVLAPGLRTNDDWDAGAWARQA